MTFQGDVSDSDKCFEKTKMVKGDAKNVWFGRMFRIEGYQNNQQDA
jgi:hypothetical protein